MQVQLPLDQMTIADKLEAMESLWADLSRRPDDLPSPDWHRDVLLDRKRLVEQGVSLPCKLPWAENRTAQGLAELEKRKKAAAFLASLS